MSTAVTGPAWWRIKANDRLDTRPSDAIALAIRLNAPLYVSERVLDTAGTLTIVEFDEDDIDAAIDQFRDFFADLAPADFVTEPLPSTSSEVHGPDDPDEEPPED